MDWIHFSAPRIQPLPLLFGQNIIIPLKMGKLDLHKVDAKIAYGSLGFLAKDFNLPDFRDQYIYFHFEKGIESESELLKEENPYTKGRQKIIDLK